MNILVLNCGSSSIKYKLYNMKDASVMAQGGIEKIGLPDSFLKITLPDGEKVKLDKEIPEHTIGIEFILDTITNKKYGCIKDIHEIDAVGHRLVHGGESFNKSVLINDEVIATVERLADLAPLHNPANLKGVFAIKKILPEVPQVGVFDTAFHQTMPDYAYMYALPYKYYEKYGVRRYGFHGTNHRYVSKKACEFLGLNYEKSKIITAHIGGGGSVCAIKNGKVIDTSMGLTPVEGLVMGTRSGDVDLGAMAYLMKKENWTADKYNEVINKESGVLGVSGISSDMRDIEAGIEAGNKRAALAMNMFNYRLVKYIGAYAAALNGVNVIVFTGGIGENQIGTREYVCENMSYLGIELDKEKNNSRGKSVEISTSSSKVHVVVIPTDEEWMIASDTNEIISK